MNEPESPGHPSPRRERIRGFREELATLEREGVLVLTAAQRAGVEAHHARVLAEEPSEATPSVDDAVRRMSWGMRVVVVLGAVAFFAALILFLDRIWGWLSLPVQGALLLVLPLALLGAAELAHRRSGATFVTGLLGLATGAGFLIALGTLGTVLNLAPSPHLLGVSAAVGLLLAVAYDQALLLALGCGFGCAYLAALGTSLSGAAWLNVVERPTWMLPATALLYAVPWWIGARQPARFATLERGVAAGLGLLSCLLLSESGDLCCAPGVATLNAALYQLAGLAASVAVVAHGLRLGVGALVNLGSIGFVLFLYVRLHSWFWDWMPKYLFCLGLAGLAWGLVIVFRRLRRQLPEGRRA